MPFDGLAIRAISRELNSLLVDSRIDKIHQPEKDELVFSIRRPRGGPLRLVISANPMWARIHITEQRKPNPNQPSALCMLLRKYLEGGKIKEIKQIGMERIIHIRIEALNEFREWQDKCLICEFMGRHSNIILVNPESGLILDAIKRVSSEISSLREVLPGREYVAPPGQGKLEPESVDFSTFAATLWQQDENMVVANALFNTCTGLSQYSAEQICLAAGLNKAMVIGECGEYELKRIYSWVRDIIYNVSQGEYSANVLYRKASPIEVAPFLPVEIVAPIMVKTYPSMNEACEAYYGQRLSQMRLQSMQNSLTRKVNEHLNKAYRKKQFQEGDLNQAAEKEIYKTWGELLTSYAHRFKKGDHFALVPDFDTGAEIEFPLDVRYTPIQNAQRFFKIYNKSQGTKRHLARMMAETQHVIDYLESVLVAVKQSESPADIQEIIEELEMEHYLKSAPARGSRKKTTRSAPRLFISSDGLEIRVGRNNYQNDRLTLKESKKTDLWLHTQKIPGSHVIVSLPPQIASIDQVPDHTLEEAAALAAYFSQASIAVKVPVDYTFRYNVKKPGGARPGMVVYDNYWTIIAVPSEDQVEHLAQHDNGQ